jgi:hypothetical protein
VRDRDVRQAVRAQTLRNHIADPDTLVLDELGLLNGNARIDIAVVNGVVHGFELKSASDTLGRLPDQITAYGAVLDYVTLVVAENHLKAASAIVPAWWGLVAAREGDGGGVELVDVRAHMMNPAIDPAALARLLWRNEALDELDQRGLAEGVRSKPRRVIYARLTEAVSLQDLRAAVRDRLKRRAGWRSGSPRT